MSKKKRHEEGFKKGGKPGEETNPDSSELNEHERFIKKLLDDPQRQSAFEWLRTDSQRTVGKFKTNRDSIAFIQEIFKLGAVEILAVRIHSPRSGIGQRSGKLVVKLPAEAEARKRIFDWCKQQGESLGFSPDLDRGENHLFLLLD